MNKKLIRPYEMSVWSLQDEFITVLKSHDIANKGQLISPQMTIKDDGTQELSFTVPMYYRDEGEYKENPLWYDIHNGAVLVNMRKIKVIFSKGSAEEEIFEFIISQVKETHTGSTLNCEITASGLAFQELGKIGYKKSLSQDDFLVEYEEWFDKYGDQDNPEIPEPRATIDYWCKKIFENSKWTYSVQMDWSVYDGTVSGDKPYSKMSQSERDVINTARENHTPEPLRRMDKVYEDDYVAAWDDNLKPVELVKFKEKERMVEAEKSNLYNITQTIAETFGVYCRYKYYYDNNYHIIGRECIFYNNYIDDRNGKIDITYPFDASQIERELDSTDLVTKMFVVPVDDEDSASGLVTIADVTANRSREDYILNFDYLYQIGSITDEQYHAINTFEKQMYLINTSLLPLEKHLAQAQVDLPEYEAKVTTAQNSQTLDKEQMEKANALLNSLTNGTGILYATAENPYRGILLTDPQNSNAYYIKISQAGVDASSIVIYTRYSNGSALDQYTTSTPDIRKDSCGNVVAIGNLYPVGDSKTFYLTFAYRPALQYENVYNTYAKKLIQDQTTEAESAKMVEQLKSTIKTLEQEQKEKLELKEKTIADFENMMGPALKEGSWQAESYTDYGNKYNETFGFTTPSTKSGNIELIWDNEPFDEEQLNYYLEGILLTKKYYLCYDLSSLRDSIKNNLDNLSYIYNVSNASGGTDAKYATIGSEAQFAFLRKDSTTIPVLLITDESAVAGGRIGVVSVSTSTSGVNTEIQELVYASTLSGCIINNPESYTQVFPRIQVNNLLLKDTEDDLMIKLNSQDLRKYYDYSVLTRKDKYYITINSKLLVDKPFADYAFQASYCLSNAALAIYLDALEVSKTNAYPQVSYTITVSAFKEELIKHLYTKLNSIVSINDSELKFENVQGYISELELSLDSPWEDKLTIKNYKTKFEDLFSTIVASTEQMKSNGYIYDRAGSAFTSNGTIKSSVIQNTIMRADLDYAFQNGDLTIDEVNGIWARSANGVVAMAGGGIFCATYKDTLGNWVWNTGITPEGINASLLTAGQIDTNLIRIYSGNDLRFQMNGEGLYAYKEIPTFNSPSTEYIVYNQNGFYFTKGVVDRVALNWDGLTLRDDKGKEVLIANKDGLSVIGKITATSGEIGGWLIGQHTLQSEGSYAGMRSADYDEDTGKIKTDIYDVFWTKGRTYNNETNQWEESGNTFSVDSNGVLHATNAVISGTITAKDGYIGSLNIATLERELKGIKIVALTGDTFKWSSDYSGEFQTPNDLSFSTVQSDVSIAASSVSFNYSIDGVNFFTVPDGIITFNTTDLSFSIKPAIMVKNAGDNETATEYYDSVVIKESGMEGTTAYEAIITLYSLFDGKSGSSGATPKFVQLNPVSYAFVKAKGSEVFLPESITITAMLSETVNAENGEWRFNGNMLTQNTNLDVYVNADNKSIVVKRNGIPEGENVGPSVVSYKNDGREWLATVWKTEDGKDGTNGKDGINGKDGERGPAGADGKPGENAVIYTVKPSVQFIRKSGSGNNLTYTPSEVRFTAYKTTGNTTEVYGDGTLTPYWSADGTVFEELTDIGTGSSILDVNQYQGSMIKVVLTDAANNELAEQTVMIMESGANGKDGKDGIIYEVRPSVNTVKRTTAGTNVPDSITFTAYKTTGSSVIPVEYNAGSIELQISTNGIDFTTMSTADGGTATIEVGNATVLRARLYDSALNLLDEQTVSVLQDGEDGKPGEAGTSPIVMVLSNENTSVVIGDTGAGSYLDGCNTTLTIYEGLTDKTADYAANLTIEADSEDTTYSVNGTTYSITGLNSENEQAYLIFKLTIGENVYTKKFVVSVLHNGAQGPQGPQGETGAEGASAYTIFLTNEFFQFNAETMGDLVGQSYTSSISVYKGTQKLGKDNYDIYFAGDKTQTTYTINGMTATLNTDKTEVTLTSSNAAADHPTGSIALYVEVNGLTYIRYLNYAIRFGSVRYYITLNTSTIVMTNGSYDPTTINYNAYYIKNSSADPVAYSNGKFIITPYGKDGALVPVITQEKVAQGSYIISENIPAGTTSIVVELQDTKGNTLDRQSVPILDSSVADVTVGSKNLLRWTRNMINRQSGRIVYYEKSEHVELLDDGQEEDTSLLYFNYSGTEQNAAWCNIQGMVIPDVGLNDIYTLSFYLYSDDYSAANNTLILREYLSDTTIGNIQRYHDNEIIKGNVLQTENYNIRLIEGSSANGKWQRVALTYHPEQTDEYFDKYTNTSYTAATANVYGLEILFSSTANIKIKKMKLEKGRLATDWSPSEYDVDYEDVLGVNLLNTSYYTNIYSKAHKVEFDVQLDPGYYTLSWNNNMTEVYGVESPAYLLRSDSYETEAKYTEKSSHTFYVEEATTNFTLYTDKDDGEGYYAVAELKLQKGEHSTGYAMSPEEVRNYYNQYLDTISGKNETMNNLIISITDVDGAIQNYTKDEFEKYTREIQELNDNFTTLNGKYTNLLASVAGLSKWESYYELSPQSDGKVALIIGDKSNSFDFKMRLDSSKLSFLKSDIEVAYVSNQKLYINYAEIVQQLRIGSSASTGYLVFKHMGNGLGVIWES